MREVLFEDGFQGGFDVGFPEDGNAWSFMKMGPIVIDPAEFEISSEEGLYVAPAGKNPLTSEPAFTLTQPQHPLMGTVDHMKFNVTVNRTSSLGVPGFDIAPGAMFNVEARFGGQQYGMEGHPFGDAVADPDADWRLGAPMLMAMCPLNSDVFDFVLTNKKVYVIYERGGAMGGGETNWAVYSYAIPVADREPSDERLYRMSYDPSVNAMRWFIDGEQVFEVVGVGRRIDRKYMLVDQGGVEEDAAPTVLNVGLGLISLLDGAIDGKALVNLTGSGSFYDPRLGEPEPVAFVDSESKDESRLFGQGADLVCKEFRVYVD
ncbi:MAG: DUF6081 family protein [Eggerthellaceae bacterium]|nr:DUF6081 family protein [Eggerthellaceae bacterium]